MVRTGASLRALCTKALICAAVTCHAQTYSTSVSNVSGQSVPATTAGNPFAGSVPTKLVPGRMPLSLLDAINLGLKHNLGLLLSRADTRAARGPALARTQRLAAPRERGSLRGGLEGQSRRGRIGQGGCGCFSISPAVGPFSYFDARAAVSQTLFDWKAISSARAAGESVKSADYDATGCSRSRSLGSRICLLSGCSG